MRHALRVDAGEARPARSIAYRPDVDGLRAVAVALVVAFHFGVPFIGGGYVGVDVFFVISGFLIASLFERGQGLGPAALADFYARRVKRLAPAFLVVAAATLVVATFLLLPDDYLAAVRSVRSSLAFVANRRFERDTTGYFAADAEQLPWLHTWSLSIEWQFYAAYPLVVLALRRLPAARRPLALALLVALAAAWSIATTTRAPAAAYFSASARAFEFLAGALVARLDVAATAWAGGPRAARRIASLALVALVGSALLFDASTPFPGAAAAAVTVLAALAILFGRDAPALSHPACVSVGRRSYGIYLWHWPVVAFAHYVQVRASPVAAIAAVVLVVALAAATYRRVERPGIALAWRPLPTFVVGGVVPLALVAAWAAAVSHYDGLPARLGPEAAHAHANLQRFADRDGDRCHDHGTYETCAFGDPASATDALLIGDSHALRARPFVRVLADDAHVRFHGLTDSECPTLLGPVGAGERPRTAACAAAVARDYALIREHRYRYVVLAQRWIGYGPGTLAGLDESLAAIVASGATPVVFAPVAENDTDTAACFYRPIKLRTPRVDDCAIERDNAFAAPQKAAVAALFARMRARHPSLVVIDPQAVQCDGPRCATVLDATPLYSDFHHLDGFGATQLGRAYLARYGNPLRPSSGVPTAP